MDELNAERSRPFRMARRAAATAALIVVVGGCSSGSGTGGQGAAAVPDHAGCRSPDPAPAGALRGSFEDANLIAGGEMFRIYGRDADPVREEVTGEVVRVDGAEAWKLDASVAVTVDDERRSDTWMLWVGFADNGFEVLCAVGPAAVPWPASGP